MIVSKEKFRVRKIKTWKNSFVQLKKRVGDYLDWQDKKEIILIILEADENPTGEEFRDKFNEFKQREAVMKHDSIMENPSVIPKEEGHGNWTE